MSLASRLRTLAGALFRRSRVESEMDEELRGHIESRAADLERAGLARAEAQRRARLEFGGYEKFKEESREAARTDFVETIRQDLHFGIRMLRKSAGFAALAILTLALGIGANTAIFSMVNSALLRPLPYKNPSRLAWVDVFLPRFNDTAVSDSEYTAWSNDSRTFQAIAAYDGGGQANLTGTGEPERIETVSVSASFFQVLAIHPAQGRSFLPTEDAPNGPLAVILTHRLWQRKFNSDPAIAGKAIALDGRSYNVIGVMSADFRFPDKTADPECLLAIQLPPKPDWSGTHPMLITRVIGRLADGVSFEQARADLTTISARSTAALPADFAPMRADLQVHVVPLHDKFVGDVRPALLILFASVGFVLLIACANIANLQLVRASARRRELAVRAAIGAGRLRLVQQLLTESALLACFGGIAGFAIGAAGAQLLRNSAPAALRQIGLIAIDYRVFAFALVITAVTTALFAVVPAFSASKPDVNSSLKDAASQSTGTAGHRRLRNALVIVELTLAFVLLIGSGLLIRSFYSLSHIPPGFNPTGVLTASTALPETSYATPQQRTAFYSQAIGRIAALPGVRDAAVVTSVPLTSYSSFGIFPIEGQPGPRPGMGPITAMDQVSAGYFRVMQIPLRAGRLFQPEDFTANPSVAIVTDAFAKQFFPNGSPLGKRVRFGRFQETWITIVGVVGDVRNAGLTHPIDPHIYFPYDGTQPFGIFLVLRADSDPRSLIPAVREQVRAIDPAQPIFNAETMDQRLADSLDSPRFNTALLSIFAALALLLAAIGIYGVISYFVSQRTHEIGVRVALGASRGDVLRLVVGHGIALIAAGVILGVAGSLALSRYLASSLYGVHPRDPATMASVAVLLLFVALAACYVPARRAMRVDPMVALRYE